MLSDKTLKQFLKNKTIKISGLSGDAIQSNSVDLTLGRGALVLKYWHVKGGVLSLDLKEKPEYEKIPGDEIIIPPSSFVLGVTKEYLELPSNIAAFIEGKSSVGRMGLFIQNASVVTPGFRGTITLELYNANVLPIRLQAGNSICQIVFFKMDQDVEKPYQGRYQGQKKALGSIPSNR